MKTLKRFLSVLLVLCLLVTGFSFAVSADFSNVSKIRKTTYEELAGISKASDSNAKVVPPGFQEVYLDDGGFTAFYIIEKEDGYLLTGTASDTFSRVRYSLTESNESKKWKFVNQGSGVYTVYSYADMTACLTVNPTTKAVTLSPSTGSDYQKWKICVSGSGNTLKCVSSNINVNNYMLVINGTSCSVSNSTYTPLAFYEVNWYIPTTSISHADIYIVSQQGKRIYPTRNPSDATGDETGLIWSSSNANIVVSSIGYVRGVTAGSATLTFTDKITRVSGSCSVTITEVGTVGILTIFSSNNGEGSSFNFSGHSFLSFQNFSSASVAFGGIDVQTDEEATIGTWGNKENHTGIWYNLEAYFMNTQGAYANSVSFSIIITQSNLSTINTLINNNDTWTYTNNCSSFATRVWNSVSAVTLNAGFPNTPSNLMSSIKSQVEYATGKQVSYTGQIGYLDNGTFVSVTIGNNDSIEEID